jgi:hypothetical protein
MTVSTAKKSRATIPTAWLRRNVVHDTDVRFGAGLIPAVLRNAHTVDAAIVMPRRASSPWMRRQPHVGSPERAG